MKAILLFLPLILLLASCTARKPWPSDARTEVTKATTAFDDSKANSPQVSDAYAITGQFERIVVVRMKYQADLLAGIESIVKKEKIRNGVILSGVGSLRGYHIHPNPCSWIGNVLATVCTPSRIKHLMRCSVW